MKSQDIPLSRDWKKGKAITTVLRIAFLALMISMASSFVITDRMNEKVYAGYEYNMVSSVEEEIPEGITEEMYIDAVNSIHTMNAYIEGKIEIAEAYGRMNEINNGAQAIQTVFSKDKEICSEIQLTYQKIKAIKDAGEWDNSDMEILSGYIDTFYSLLQ